MLILDMIIFYQELFQSLFCKSEDVGDGSKKKFKKLMMSFLNGP